MVSMNLVTRNGDGLAAVALPGELDVTDAASVAAALAAPQDRVLRVLAAIRLAEVFCVHASVEEAAGSAGRSRPVALRVA